MLLTSLKVINFRSISEVTIRLEPLTALVGPNGAGKSAFLAALDLFYQPADSVAVSDFYNEDTATDITITATFGQLDEEATQQFSKYLNGGTLSVSKVIAWNDGKPKSSYHGTVLRNPAFQPIRECLEAADRGASAREALRALNDSGRFPDLPNWTTKDGTEEALLNWEEAHPEHCALLPDEGQFFGFRQVGQGYLGKYTQRLFIPAVRSAASDAAETKGAVFYVLMDLVVRSALVARKEIQDFQKEINTKYADILDPEKLPELASLAKDLTSSLRTFVPASEVRLTWQPLSPLELTPPRADLKLVEDGFPSPVDKCGHGLQRAFVVALLQRLAREQARPQPIADLDGKNAPPSVPHLVLMIEEPELYQHPNRQRHFAQVLRDLTSAGKPGGVEQTQVIYSTHSPHFVGIDRIESIRLLRKCETGPGLPKHTTAVSTTLARVAHRIWVADGQKGEPYTAQTLMPRLRCVMTPYTNEGFFADLAVLVEGEGDRAALLAMASTLGIDPESLGISIIPCGGKTNIDRPAAIFNELGIQTYLVWDSDKAGDDPKPGTNRLLLNLVGAPPEDFPAIVADRYACFENDLDNACESDIGEELYTNLLLEAKEYYGIQSLEHAKKNPFVIERLLAHAIERNAPPTTLQTVLRGIVNLRG